MGGMLFALKEQKKAIMIKEVKSLTSRSALVLLGSIIGFIFLRSPEACGIGYIGLITGPISFGSFIACLDALGKLDE